MATTATFSTMLNDYLPNSLFRNELVKKDWILQNCEIDDSWLGGSLVVPFKGAHASSVAFAALTATDDIAEDALVRGEVTTMPEAFFTLLLRQKDIMQHGKINEQSLVRVLPDLVDDFTMMIKNIVSTSFLNGTHFDKLAAGTVGTAGGVITVTRPDRWEIGQKFFVDDDDSAASSACYVRTIDVNASQITAYSARSGGSVVDLSGYSAAQNAKCYHPGSQASGFSSIRGALLPASAGGDSTIAGQTKTAYPYLQSISADGSSASGGLGITAVNIVEKIFDHYITVRQKGKGQPRKVLMSYKNWGNCLKAIETSKGGFNVDPGSRKASQYGWDTIEIGGPGGRLELVAIQEMDDSEIYYLDPKAFKVYTNGLVKRIESPDGDAFFTVRDTSAGYSYVLDYVVAGDIVCERPNTCGAIYGISY